MTHDELVERAAIWLKKEHPIVVTEMTSGARETPDAIGWSSWGSVIIEAKASINDFRADHEKFFRKYPEYGMGRLRYFIVPKELENTLKDNLPSGWGLLVCKGNRIYQIIKSEVFENNWKEEMILLGSIIRRIASNSQPFRGVNVRCYTYESDVIPRASLHVDISEKSNSHK